MFSDSDSSNSDTSSENVKKKSKGGLFGSDSDSESENESIWSQEDDLLEDWDGEMDPISWKQAIQAEQSEGVEFKSIIIRNLNMNFKTENKDERVPHPLKMKSFMSVEDDDVHILRPQFNASKFLAEECSETSWEDLMQGKLIVENKIENSQDELRGLVEDSFSTLIHFQDMMNSIFGMKPGMKERIESVFNDYRLPTLIQSMDRVIDSSNNLFKGYFYRDSFVQNGENLLQVLKRIYFIVSIPMEVEEYFKIRDWYRLGVCYKKYQFLKRVNKSKVLQEQVFDPVEKLIILAIRELFSLLDDDQLSLEDRENCIEHLRLLDAKSPDPGQHFLVSLMKEGKLRISKSFSKYQKWIHQKRNDVLRTRGLVSVDEANAAIQNLRISKSLKTISKISKQFEKDLKQLWSVCQRQQKDPQFQTYHSLIQAYGDDEEDETGIQRNEMQKASFARIVMYSRTLDPAYLFTCEAQVSINRALRPVKLVAHQATLNLPRTILASVVTTIGDVEFTSKEKINLELSANQYIQKKMLSLQEKGYKICSENILSSGDGEYHLYGPNKLIFFQYINNCQTSKKDVVLHFVSKETAKKRWNQVGSQVSNVLNSAYDLLSVTGIICGIFELYKQTISKLLVDVDDGSQVQFLWIKAIQSINETIDNLRKMIQLELFQEKTQKFQNYLTDISIKGLKKRTHIKITEIVQKYDHVHEKSGLSETFQAIIWEIWDYCPFSLKLTPEHFFKDFVTYTDGLLLEMDTYRKNLVESNSCLSCSYNLCGNRICKKLMILLHDFHEFKTKTMEKLIEDLYELHPNLSTEKLKEFYQNVQIKLIDLQELTYDDFLRFALTILLKSVKRNLLVEECSSSLIEDSPLTIRNYLLNIFMELSSVHATMEILCPHFTYRTLATIISQISQEFHTLVTNLKDLLQFEGCKLLSIEIFFWTEILSVNEVIFLEDSKSCMKETEKMINAQMQKVSNAGQRNLFEKEKIKVLNSTKELIQNHILFLNFSPSECEMSPYACLSEIDI